VDQEAGADHGEQHQAERQLEDGRAVAEQAHLGNAPAVEEQQWRQEHEEKDVRLEAHAMAGGAGDGGAERDLDQRQGDGERQYPHQVAARHHRQQHCQYDSYLIHRYPSRPNMA